MARFRASVVHILAVVMAVVFSGASARAESVVAPIQISVPSVTYDRVGSSNSPSKSYFAFTAVAGNSYLIMPQRVDPVTSVIYGPASFYVTIYTNDAKRAVVANGSASNLSPWVTPPLHSGGYVIEINDGLVGYASVVDYYLTTGVAATGGVPTGPIPGAPALTISSLSAASSSVKGGTSVVFTVRLSAAAPGGGSVVTLTSSSNNATVPSSVTVPAGATQATFTVTTRTVTRNTSATITARNSAGSRTASITITK
jgi:hypothetical protein